MKWLQGSRGQGFFTVLVLAFACWSFSDSASLNASTPQLPEAFSISDPGMAARLVGGACNLQGGTATVCCTYTHTYSNISGVPGNLYGDTYYWGVCDMRQPLCQILAVSGCNVPPIPTATTSSTGGL